MLLLFPYEKKERSNKSPTGQYPSIFRICTTDYILITIHGSNRKDQQNNIKMIMFQRMFVIHSIYSSFPPSSLNLLVCLAINWRYNCCCWTTYLKPTIINSNIIHLIMFVWAKRNVSIPFAKPNRAAILANILLFFLFFYKLVFIYVVKAWRK